MLDTTLQDSFIAEKAASSTLVVNFPFADGYWVKKHTAMFEQLQ